MFVRQLRAILVLRVWVSQNRFAIVAMRAKSKTVRRWSDNVSDIQRIEHSRTNMKIGNALIGRSISLLGAAIACRERSSYSAILPRSSILVPARFHQQAPMIAARMQTEIAIPPRCRRRDQENRFRADALIPSLSPSHAAGNIPQLPLPSPHKVCCLRCRSTS